MISKELFVQTMERLEKLERKMNNVDEALHELSPDFCGFYIPETIDVVVDLMRDVFKDKNDWLGYFIYEQDFLNTLQSNDVQVVGVPVDLTSWDKVYDFLIKNMEE